MNIGSICTSDAVTIDRDTSLHQAAQYMREEHVGALVVTSAGAVVGVVTDRDLAIEVLARGRDSASVSVGALVTGRLVTVPFDASLSDAIAAMEEEGVSRLLVTGPTQELIGVVSIDDLLEALAGDMARLAKSRRNARDREMKSGLPSSLIVDSQPLMLSDGALLPTWQRTV